MKTYLKVLLQIVIISQIFIRIECQDNDTITETMTSPIDSFNNTSEPLQPPEEEPTNDTTSVETSVGEDDTNDNTEETPSQEIQDEYQDFGEFTPPSNGPLITDMTGSPMPPPVPSAPFEGSYDSEWWPVVLLVVVFICCAILCIVWSIMKCMAIKKVEESHKGGAHQQKHISDTVPKDDKPDEAPAVGSGQSTSTAHPSDTPRSSIDDQGKSDLESSVRSKSKESV